MKKQILFIPCFLFAIISGYSQEKRNYLLLSAGPSFPISNFTSKDLNNNNAGFAKAGQHIDISFVHKLNKTFGIAASIYAQKNPHDTKTLNAKFSDPGSAIYFLLAMASNPSSLPVKQDTYTNWTFEKHAWSSAAFLVGGFAELPLNSKNKFSFIAKAMAGITATKSPELKGKSISDTTIAGMTQKSAPGFGFCFQFSGGVKYDLNKRISLIASAVYFGTDNIIFKKTKFSIAASKNINGLSTASSATFTGETRQVLQSLSATAGVSFRL